MFSCHSALADAVISKENVCNQWERHHHHRRGKKSGRVERALALVRFGFTVWLNLQSHVQLRALCTCSEAQFSHL